MVTFLYSYYYYYRYCSVNEMNDKEKKIKKNYFKVHNAVPKAFDLKIAY